MFHNPFTYKSMTVGRVVYFKSRVLLVKMLNRGFKALVIMITVTAAKKLTLGCVPCMTVTRSPIMLLTRFFPVSSTETFETSSTSK